MVRLENIIGWIDQNLCAQSADQEVDILMFVWSEGNYYIIFFSFSFLFGLPNANANVHLAGR